RFLLLAARFQSRPCPTRLRTDTFCALANHSDQAFAAITAAAMFRRTHGQNVPHRKAPARHLALHHAAVVPAAASRTNFGVRHMTSHPGKSRRSSIVGAAPVAFVLRSTYIACPLPGGNPLAVGKDDLNCLPR